MKTKKYPLMFISFMISAYLHVHPVTYVLDKKVRRTISIDQGHNRLY